MTNAISEKKISIIIPAYNEEKNIANCLRAIANQTYKSIEIILVDDKSEDNTYSIATKYAEKLRIEVKILKLDKHKERGRARNLGAKRAKGHYLLFVDADMLLEKNVLKMCVNQIEKEKDMAAIIIPEKSFGTSFWAKCKALEKRCYLGDDSIEAARFFKKNIFWKVGGWDEEMVSGEDWDLTRRIRSKFKVGRVEAFILHNEGKLTLIKTFKKKFYYALKSGIYLKKYPLKFTDLIFFILRPAYFRNWRLFLSTPLYGIGIFVLKFIEIIAGGLGFLFSKLPNLL